MPFLTDPQIQGLASPALNAGTELDPDWQDPYPDAPCWGWALFGGPGGNGNNTPPVIFEQALLLNENRNLVGVRPGFADWVAATFQIVDATAQATIIENEFADALIDLDDDAQLACTDAFARLCIIVSGLTPVDGPTNYSIVMASDHWYTWEHWALGLANNVNAPGNPPVQYSQRDAGINPVNTRCNQVWGEHPILTTVYIKELHQGHIDYLQHAVGWP
ncbi:MAG TPA: hypothetical protein VNZ04_10290 [Trinickia sp.]|nr:hypothetical protein [Trinickia sp.]